MREVHGISDAKVVPATGTEGEVSVLVEGCGMEVRLSFAASLTVGLTREQAILIAEALVGAAMKTTPLPIDIDGKMYAAFALARAFVTTRPPPSSVTNAEPAPTNERG